MELQNMQEIILDFNSTTTKVIYAKQYDNGTRYVHITCYQNGEIYRVSKNYSASLRVCLPSGKLFMDFADIQDDGTLLIELTNGILSEDGKVKAEISIYDGSDETDIKKLSTMNFTIISSASVGDLEEEKASKSYEEFDALISKATKDYTYVITESTEAMEAAKVSEDNAKVSENNCSNYASVSETNANNSETSKNSSLEYSNYSKSYAIGTNGEVRTGDDTDNAKHYYLQTKNIAETLGGSLKPRGTITFEELPDITNPSVVEYGDMYNISNSFVSTNLFKDGGGKSYGVGRNVYATTDRLWDVLASSDSKSSTIVSDTEPESQNTDDFWIQIYE